MKLHIAGIFLLCACGAFAAAENIATTTVPVIAAPEKQEPKPVRFAPEFLDVSEPIVVPTPLFAEEKNLQDRVFDADAKLRLRVPAPRNLEYSRAVESGNGFFSSPERVSETVPALKDTLTVFRTFVTPQAFTRGKILVSSPQKCEVWANGKKLTEKLCEEADAEQCCTASADFNFEIERCEILVKVLSRKDSTLPPTVKIEIEPKDADVPAVSFSDGNEKPPVTIAGVNEAERIFSADVSPDGKFVLLSFSRLREDGSVFRRTEVRDASDGKTVFFDDSGRSCSWMPNGSRLYFRRNQSDDLFSYVAYDFATRRESVLAENLPSADHLYIWLPDESGLIVVKTEKWTEESPDWTRVLNPEDRSPGWRDRSFLYRYDLKTGVFEPLTAGARTTGFAGISPDSRKILFSTSKIDYAQPEFGLNALYVLDLETLKTEAVFENEKYGVSAGAWSPDSKKLLLLAGPDAFGGIGSALPAGTRANSFDTQAFIYDFETKSLDAISRDFDPTISSGAWAGDGNIYFSTVDRDRESVYRWEPATGKFTKMNVPAEIVSGFSVQKNPSSFVPAAFALASGPFSFAKVYKVDLEKNESSLFFENGAALNEKFAAPQIEPWTFTASDGTEIDGCYFLPADFDASKKYPLIVYYYGGTTPTARVLGSHYPFPLYAAQGYVVYVVQPSGTIGYGQEFSARHLNAWGKRTADDIIEGVKRFCAEHPFVNEKKIGCIGASYGGFMTMYLQTRTDIFAAAVAHAGISDISSYWGEGRWGYSYNAIAAAGSFPWKNREIFVEQSPLFSADKINTPILLCHGVSDVNVPVGESIQMFTALKLMGKPVELLTFTAEDHGIMNYARRRQWIKSHLAWFARWLKDQPDWWNTLYPDKNW